MNDLSVGDNYNLLKGKVLRLLDEGKRLVEEAVLKETVRTYHGIGRVLDQYLLVHEERAGYGEQVVARLAKDVGLSQTSLYQARAFFLLNPILHTCVKLTWSHYRLLLRLPDSEARKACELAAVENGWSVRELEAQIRSGVFEVGALVEQSVRTLAPDLNLPALRGQFYTYRLVDDPDGENTRVDLGFGIHSSWSIVGGNGLKAGQLVKVIREGKGGFRCEVAQGRPSAFYTYQARVLSVIDGDTLWLDIDCGFRVWTRQKVRLRGIDAPELGTAEGQRAKDFVVRALSEGSFVAVTTTKPDKYDRYLADVFYGKGTEDRVLQDGWFLSRTLLEAGLATRFRG